MSRVLPKTPSSYPQLVEAWADAVESFAELAEGLSTEQWQAPSILPGWTHADIAAHVVGIERDLLGRPEPYRELNWEDLPHADDLFSRYTELAVAARRDTPQDEVCGELRAAIAARRRLLDRQPHDLGETISGPGGWELPRGVVMRMRIFDVWVHIQDIRASLGEEGDLDGPAAEVSASQMVKGLGRSWAREVKASADQSALITVVEPGLSFAVLLRLDDDGRGIAEAPNADADADANTDVTLTMTWPTFAAGCCGRETFRPEDVAVSGDTHLASRVLNSLNIAP